MTRSRYCPMPSLALRQQATSLAKSLLPFMIDRRRRLHGLMCSTPFPAATPSWTFPNPRHQLLGPLSEETRTLPAKCSIAPSPSPTTSLTHSFCPHRLDPWCHRVASTCPSSSGTFHLRIRTNTRKCLHFEVDPCCTIACLNCLLTTVSSCSSTRPKPVQRLSCSSILGRS